MNKPWSEYQHVVVETYCTGDRPPAIRVRPIHGQSFPITMNVECSKTMRKAYPVGTLFRIYAKEILYSHYNWPCEVVM
jgi:hypothetical protein